MWYSDPFDGFGVRFLDEKKKPVNIETKSYYGSQLVKVKAFFQKLTFLHSTK